MARRPCKHSPRSKRDHKPRMNTEAVTANGQSIAAEFPCTLEQFLVAQKLLPRSVVVELNGEAVAPSEFADRSLSPGDSMEIVKIVAGG